MAYKPGQIILLDNKHKSHSWRNGLHVVLGDHNNTLDMAKLNDTGHITIDDGTVHYCSTGSVDNHNLKLTPMKYKLPKDFKYK